METNTLFTPLELGAVSRRNRIVMAPTTRMRAKMRANIPWQLNATYYRQRASAWLRQSAGPVTARGKAEHCILVALALHGHVEPVLLLHGVALTTRDLARTGGSDSRAHPRQKKQIGNHADKKKKEQK
jgi:hypothetical protein